MKHLVFIVIVLINLQLMAQKKFNLLKFNKTNALCENGSARIVIQDTVENYTVLWSNGNANFIAQNLNPGDYSVKITWRLKLDTTIYFTIDEKSVLFILAVLLHQITMVLMIFLRFLM